MALQSPLQDYRGVNEKKDFDGYSENLHVVLIVHFLFLYSCNWASVRVDFSNGSVFESTHRVLCVPEGKKTKWNKYGCENIY